ncbi:MAG: polysaccharide biosynthesis protein [Rhodobacterales bacterium]|nr:MAG: polysaccharide biosynthesis protein [Rhodobacterales bacterium]
MSARVLLTLATVFLVAACSLPRGAAIVSEVIKENDSETPQFQVVEVHKDTVAQIAKWPATGWHGHYHWLSAKGGSNGATIRPGDKVTLVIWDNQDNSLLTGVNEKVVTMSGLIVSPGGTIFVPYLEDVRVSGMSPNQARKKIQKKMEPIIPSAQVQLSHEPGQGNSVDLVSGVQKPGSYPLANRNTTILSVIAQGGGIATTLRNPLVRLIRGGKTYEVRADALFSTASKNVLMRGNDKVLVEEDSRYFTALGATGKEELVYFEKEQITALEAMSIIGGLSDARANPKGVLILRDYPAKALRSDGAGPNMQQVVFTFDLTTADGLFAARNFSINPKDTVLATESPVNAARTIFGLLGSLVGIANSTSNL